MHIEIGKQLVPTVPALISGFIKYRHSGEANSCTAFHDIYFLSWSQKNSPLFCVIHQINPVNIILFKMQFYDILLSTLTVSCSISKIRYVVSICQPLFIFTAPNSHRSINYSVAEQRKRSGHVSLTHNAGPLQLTSGQSTARGTETRQPACHGVPEHTMLNEVLHPSRGNPEEFVSSAKNAECKILASSSSPIILPSTLRRLTERQRLKVQQKKKTHLLWWMRLDIVPFLFFRDIDKTERTFLMKAQKQEERRRQKSVVWVGGNEKSWESERHTVLRKEGWSFDWRIQGFTRSSFW